MQTQVMFETVNKFYSLSNMPIKEFFLLDGIGFVEFFVVSKAYKF